MGDIVHIDGMMGEGGGQVLRTSTGLAALLGRPVRIVNIRANRPKPGLAAQHLAGIRALCRLTGGEADGLAVGSREVLFRPGQGRKSRLEVDVGTAGSVTLLLQGLLIALSGVTSRTELVLRGGTDVAWSPPFLYFSEVLSPLLVKMGFQIRAELVRVGFYPKGGGEVQVWLRAPVMPSPLRLDTPADAGEVTAEAVASEDLARAKVAERLISGARGVLPGLKGKKRYFSTLSTGCSIVLRCQSKAAVLGADCLGERGVRAEEIGRRAAEDLRGQLGAGCTLDRWASDQILPFLALASGPSSFIAPELTSHARTNMEVIRTFLPVAFESTESGGVVRVEVVPQRT
ncbi:MAG: RNA 3'-terminal phosphate cyclase [bacterium]|nr:MAG: RNA 3'-terminal phosphate cyclase [bacterium]